MAVLLHASLDLTLLLDRFSEKVTQGASAPFLFGTIVCTAVRFISPREGSALSLY